MNARDEYILNRQLRQNKIIEIVERQKPIALVEKIGGLKGKDFKVYEIPLECLVFNHLNDRFASRRREYISENKKDLSADNVESQNVISDFIWKSNIRRNKETLEDILVNKQQEYGVITQDGRIIDGNRRARILQEIYYSDEGTYKNISKDDFKYFKAIILDGNIDDKEIQLLETTLQMGVDEKVDYNAIEKYLKVNKLKNEVGLSYKEIAARIKSIKNEKEAANMDYIYNLMCEYLVYIDAPEKFSLVEKMEDHFIKLASTLNYYEVGKYDVGWNPDDNDIEELKAIAFNYIRAGYEGKHFRNLMGGQRDQSGVFSNADVWEKFKNKHNGLIDDVEKQIRSKTTKNEFKSIEERESFYVKKVKETIKGHLDGGIEALNNKKNSNRPRQLSEEALAKLDSIDMNFFVTNYDDTTYRIFNELSTKINEMKERVIRDVFNKRKQ